MDFIDGNHFPSGLTIDFRYMETPLLSLLLRYEASRAILDAKLKEIFKKCVEKK